MKDRTHGIFLQNDSGRENTDTEQPYTNGLATQALVQGGAAETTISEEAPELGELAVSTSGTGRGLSPFSSVRVWLSETGPVLLQAPGFLLFEPCTSAQAWMEV